MKTFYLAAAFIFLAACSNHAESYVFRNDIRPEYTKVMSPTVLSELGNANVTLIDVRLNEDLAKSPTLIAGATHRDPEMISDWADKLPKDKPVVVYCVKGKWVSQKAASYLNENGYDVYSLDGGLDAWRQANKN